MSAETDDLATRLAALEGATGKKTPRRGAPLAAVLGVAGLATLGGLAYAALGPEAASPMETAAPDEFQGEGSGFGDLAPIAKPAPPAAPVPAKTGPSETERELMASLARLRDELAALRDSSKDPGDTAATDAVAELTAQMAALQKEASASKRTLERQLTERDRQLEQLRMDLELAQLQQPGPSDALRPTEDELRLAALERRRTAEAEARAERIASPMIAYSGAGNRQDDTALDAVLSAEDAFLRAGALAADVTRAEVIANPSHTVPQGTMIQAVTETALDSTLPGAIRAVVSEDVHAYDGSRVLIPRGARLIGRYRSDVALAQSRVMVAWDRIILPDNQSVEISAFGGDALGRSGTTGFVDTRFGERFGSAALISLIGALPAAAAGQIENDTAAGIGGDVGTDLRDSTRNVMQDYLSLTPVIHVDQGTRITVMVDRDLEIF